MIDPQDPPATSTAGFRGQRAPIEDRGVEAHPIVDLSLVVPVFNEAESLRPFLARVDQVFASRREFRLNVVFVNDGSTDETLVQLRNLQHDDNRIRIVDLSRNFGKEAALTAGLQVTTDTCVVPIDVDLQDPVELIPEMVTLWRQGFDVVLGRRVDRASDSWAKRTSSNWFYRVHNRVAEPTIPENVGDFRLIDQCVVEALRQLPESRRFMKGLFSWVGFRTTMIDYTRAPRIAGTSKFNGWRLWNFALEGLTSFSTSPLRIWTYIGVLVALLSFLYGMFIILRVLVVGVDTPGFASLFVAVTFLGGLQLIGIGVIGEYLGRTYHEAKRRPVYVVRRIYEPAGKDRGPEGA